MLRLAVPSDGELHEPSLQFLKSCGMPIRRANTRRYTANIPSLSKATVLFQRTADITSKVDEGSADIGIVGLDRFLELHRAGGSAMLVMEDLGFGNCDLVLAVPDSWVDVTSTADLADISAEFREQAKDLRIATKYPHLVERFLYRKGVNFFNLVPASGAIEAAPAVGFADVIADISSSGITLKENRLKTLSDGTILSSQACLIGNRDLLNMDYDKLEQAKIILERIEAHATAQEYCRITANVAGSSAEAIASNLQKRGLGGLHGPTISKVYSPGEKESWYAVTLVLNKSDLLKATDSLRGMGGYSTTVFQPDYVFQKECSAYKKLVESLGKSPVAKL